MALARDHRKPFAALANVSPLSFMRGKNAQPSSVSEPIEGANFGRMRANAVSCLTEHTVFGQSFLVGRLPAGMARDACVHFPDLWNLHPAEIFATRQPFTGKRVPVPRWQQAYGRDYRYSGTTNRALPVPVLLEPFLAWVQSAFEPRLNGLLVNWYDADLMHRIGPHRDSIADRVEGTPIVTISLGAYRVFRLRPTTGKGWQDFEATHGTVFVVPWQTNHHLKHEVPHRASDTGRRISITARAFAS
jgi:alkylated DNA repair dioxygenase AlkB